MYSDLKDSISIVGKDDFVTEDNLKNFTNNP